MHASILKYFIEVASCGSVRKASERLYVAASAVNRQIHKLEDELGVELFDRMPNGLRLNPAGERVMGYFRGIRGSMEALNRELQELQLGSVGKFSLGSIMAASPGRLTDALTKLKADHPLLAVEIAVDTSDKLLAQLHEGVLEVVVGRPVGPEAASCTFRAIEDESLEVVVGNEHPLARRSRVAFADLLDYTWILQPSHSPMRDLIEREFRVHHAVMPPGLIETGSILTTINLIRKSQMVGVIPATVAQRDAEHGVLSIVRYAIRHKLSTYGSIVRSDRPLSVPAKQFLELLHRKP